MKPKQKEMMWLSIVIAFYVLTGFWGVYDISQMSIWPIFAIPMSLFLIKTGQKEIVGLVGVVLSVVISFLSTGKFHPAVISSFLLFILAPAFVFGILYGKKASIPRIIIATTVTVFLSVILFLTFSKILGVDYLDMYFSSLDTFQNIWNDSLTNPEVQKLLPEGENVLEVYVQIMGRMVLQAKRTYPATLFTAGLVGSTIHLLIIQLIARISSWDRPAMKDILNVGLSRVAAWVLIGLWMANMQLSAADTVWTFATESMLIVLFTLFQIIGLISVIVMTMRLGAKGITRIILTIISVFWFIFNPTLLIIIGCLDSMFNFRKVKTLI
ncbi:MAG TPA: DUF2232 domain-containing protein [Epulopiscium sp.]|nr:DUF2232 domain-containing protein [Candidatus Epulonipiscium sp.]